MYHVTVHVNGNMIAKYEKRVKKEIRITLIPKHALQLVQSSFASPYLMKAKFFGKVYRKVYGFLSIMF